MQKLCKQDGMMKTRLETNIYGYPLRLVLLFKLAYSDGADSILSCCNTNKECGSVLGYFLFFRQNVILRAKLVKIVYLQLLIKHD